MIVCIQEIYRKLAYLTSLINLTLSEVHPGPPTGSKTELSRKTVDNLKPKTIIKNNSITDAAEVLDTALAIFYFAISTFDVDKHLEGD